MEYSLVHDTRKGAIWERKKEEESEARWAIGNYITQMFVRN